MPTRRAAVLGVVGLVLGGCVEPYGGDIASVRSAEDAPLVCESPAWTFAGGVGSPPPIAPGVTPPTVRTHADAIYPTSALAARRTGDVVVRVVVDVEGRVSRAEIETSAGAELDDAALTAVREWTFSPAMRGGKPVAARIRIPFHLGAALMERTISRHFTRRRRGLISGSGEGASPLA